MQVAKYFTALALLAAFNSDAQTNPKEIAANPNKAGGVYYAYPEIEHTTSAAPKGYSPFYISHYGRHGSRYLISDTDYTNVASILDKAAVNGKLTEYGHLVKCRIDSLLPEAHKRGGNLSPLGVRQHRGIAERMYANYPEVFKGQRNISARSTVVIRCVLSMDAFCERLKELNPGLITNREASNRYMDYLNYHSPESNAYTSGDWKIEYEAFVKDRVNPKRLMDLLFNDRDYVGKNVRPEELYWGLYWIAMDVQNMETKVDFTDLFTPQELFDLWECGNYHNYVCDANYAGSNGLVVGNASNLLHNIIESADAAISGGGVDSDAATLRFGHDGNLMPLAAILELGNAGVSVADPNEISQVWSNFKISPMAGNIQMVFYRHRDKSKPFLVKFLLNEEEMTIPVETDVFPFYDWSEVKEYYLGKYPVEHN